MRLTQEQIIVNFLAKRPGEWVVSHQLEKANLDGHWIGTRGTRTARGLAEAGKFVDTEGVIGPKGMTYFIETTRRPDITQDGRSVKYAHYRVVATQAKQPKFAYVERGGVRYEVPLQPAPVASPGPAQATLTLL